MSREACEPSGLLVIVPFFFFNDTATTEIYTLSLHDALPILPSGRCRPCARHRQELTLDLWLRSEEHTSELQSHLNLVCRLLLEKKTTLTVREIVQACCREKAVPDCGRVEAQAEPRHRLPQRR